MRRRLVGDAVGIAQILDGDVLGLLRVEKAAPHLLLRHEHGGGEVVDLDALGEELRVVGRHLVVEHEMTEGLQGERPCVVLAGLRLRQIDAPVREVAHRPG